MLRDKTARAGPVDLPDSDMDNVNGGTGGVTVHTVTHGETISMISRKYKLPSFIIAQANSETIISTAQKHGIYRDSLEEYSAYLYAGEQLNIPIH